MHDRDDDEYDEFMAELKAIDDFRQLYSERVARYYVDGDDPHMRRLMEALAYFTVRSRRAARANVNATWQRLYASYFEYLLAPVPAMAIVQADGMSLEAVRLQRGTRFHMLDDDDVHVGTFTSLRDVRLLPIGIERLMLQPRDGGYRLSLCFAYLPRDQQCKQPVETVALHVRYLDDYRGSFELLDNLRTHLLGISVVYDDDPDGAGLPCQVHFGAHDEARPDEGDAFLNPIQRVRFFFQFPEMDLFAHVHVPPNATGAWKRFTLRFELGPGYDLRCGIQLDHLRLFAVPVVNVVRAAAQTIECDGTRSSYPVLSADPREAFAVHSIISASEFTKTGHAPLRRGILPGADHPAWDVELRRDEHDRHIASVLLRWPEAFQTPRKVAVDAYWFQPQISDDPIGRFTPMLPGHGLTGVSWSLLGSVRAHADNPLLYDLPGLLQLQGLRLKSELDRDDVVALLTCLGTPRTGPFQELARNIAEFETRDLPDPDAHPTGTRRVHAIRIEGYDSLKRAADPMVSAFIEAMKKLLQAWSPSLLVERVELITRRGPQLPAVARAR